MDVKPSASGFHHPQATKVVLQWFEIKRINYKFKSLSPDNALEEIPAEPRLLEPGKKKDGALPECSGLQ